MGKAIKKILDEIMQDSMNRMRAIYETSELTLAAKRLWREKRIKAKVIQMQNKTLYAAKVKGRIVMYQSAGMFYLAAVRAIAEEMEDAEWKKWMDRQNAGIAFCREKKRLTNIC